MSVPHGQLIGAILLEMVSWRLIFLLIGPALTLVGKENGHRAASGWGWSFSSGWGADPPSGSRWDFTSPHGLRCSPPAPTTEVQDRGAQQ